MVLKRILVTALSALGLGALAAGTASGQTAGSGNIPAPDIFDDQITCSMNVPAMSPTPTVVPMGGMTSPLADAIGMGTAPITDSETLGLGYVIPPGGSNCGKGPVVVGGNQIGPFNAVTDNMGTPTDTSDDNPGEGAIATDVAMGYSELLGKFEAVYGNPGATTGGTARALQSATKAYNDAVEAGTTGTALTALAEARDRAQAAHTKAMNAFNAASGGPIYEAGVAEWMAKAAVTKSISDYNKAVEAAYGTDGGVSAGSGGAKGLLDTLTYVDGDGGSKYVPLGATSNQLVGTVVTITDGMATVVQTALANYVNRNLDQAPATVDSMSGATTISASNFDAAGNLVVPMQDADSDDSTPATPVFGAVTSVAGIRTVAMNHELAAKALEKLRDENVNAVNQQVFDEAARRARLEANYYNELYQTMLTDTVNHNAVTTDDPQTPADETAPFSIASRYGDYIAASNKRVEAAADLEAKVKAREDATVAVRNAFNSPQNFYQQLVDRRTALKAAADKDVTDAQADGGTASKALTDKAEAAQKALETAQMAQANLSDLFADENDPTVDLIGELLKTGGDDGQAIVDAISSNYDTANSAKTTADKVAEDVAGLTGDDGAVSQNTANIKMNADDIEKLDGRVAMNEAEIWDADGNSRIDANEMRSMTNATNIATNATNIATNAENIMGLRTDVDQNADDIMTNAGNIMTNSGRITANEGAISSNADAIASNMNSIGQNASAIGRNSEMITGLQDQMEIVRAGVAASMALAGMPAINGRGVSIGVGSYDGESAFAVGFQIQGEMASFKVGVTSAGGETGASAGVGFQF